MSYVAGYPFIHNDTEIPSNLQRLEILIQLNAAYWSVGGPKNHEFVIDAPMLQFVLEYWQYRMFLIELESLTKINDTGNWDDCYLRWRLRGTSAQRTKFENKLYTAIGVKQGEAPRSGGFKVMTRAVENMLRSEGGLPPARAMARACVMLRTLAATLPYEESAAVGIEFAITVTIKAKDRVLLAPIAAIVLNQYSKKYHNASMRELIEEQTLQSVRYLFKPRKPRPAKTPCSCKFAYLD